MAAIWRKAELSELEVRTRVISEFGHGTSGVRFEIGSFRMETTNHSIPVAI